MKKAVCKGNLKLGHLSIPVAIYVGADSICLSGHLLHEDDGGRITTERICELCGQTNPSTYSALFVNNVPLRLTTEIKDGLLDRKTNEFVVESSHTLVSLSNLLRDQQLVPQQLFEIKAQEQSLKLYSNPNEVAFATLLAKLQSRRRFLLLRVPAGGMSRYAVLMADSSARFASLYTLYYSEELRQWDHVTVASDKQLARQIDQVIDSISADFNRPSAAKYLKRIQSWIKSETQPRKVKVNA